MTEKSSESNIEESKKVDSSDESKPKAKGSAETASDIESGPVSKFLTSHNLSHKELAQDNIGIEIIGVETDSLFKIALTLQENGFDYLQCQGAYDEGPGENLVCFYHLIAMKELCKELTKGKNKNLREVRLKVFLPRNGDLKVPSLYNIFKGSDWQERETYDMFGINFVNHPHPKRLLMPEDWKGWPLRKDYIQPDFYEMQDAY